jgi:tetratricopeptide (TPR) repeat protein
MAKRTAVLALLLLPLVGTPLAAQQPRLLRDLPAPGWRGCPASLEADIRATIQQRQEAERLAASAMQAAILGDTNTSLELLSRAARLDPASADIAYHLGRAYEEAGMPAEATNAYCRYTLLAPDAPDAAEVSQRATQLAVAANLAAGPSADALRAFENGIAAFHQNRLSDAEDAFTRAWQHGDGWAAPLYNRALVRLALGQREAAVADLRAYLTAAESRAHGAEVVDLLASLPAPARAGPSAAGTLVAGLAVPGLGHFTTGRPGRGALFMTAAAGAVGAGLLIERVRVQCLSPPVEGICPADLVVDERVDRPFLLPGAAVAALVGVFGAYDAYRGVKRSQRSEARTGAAVGISMAPVIGVSRGGTNIELMRIRFR